MNRRVVLGIILIFIVLISGSTLYIDLSGDGLTVYQEIKHGVNPLVSDTDDDGLSDYEEIMVRTTNPRQEDTNSDGLTDYEEVEKYGTDPLKKDTNNDGLTDYEEVKVHGTDPLDFDTDNDGLVDSEEINKYNTDPTLNDTDNDGLSDYNEVKNYNSSPVAVDTNNDGLTDYEEVKVHRTDPAVNDTSGDGLTDYEEVKIYETNPLENDTDDDGLTDYEEVEVYETDPLKKDTTGDGLTDYEQVNTYNTDPAVNDTNNDGLTDYEEIKVYNTDPLVRDTNGDGLSDYENVQHGLDPLETDTSNDSFRDHYSVEQDAIDPSKKSILVQVSYMKNVDVPRNLLDEIERESSDASNDTYDLNFVVDKDPVKRRSSVSVEEYYNDYYDDSDVFNKKGLGYYHLLLASDIDTSQIDHSDNVLGATVVSTDGMLVKEIDNSDAYASTIAHELGHQLGLTNDVYNGIDSDRYQTSTYPSTLNYNWVECVARSTCGEDHKYTYSTGDGFNDWKFIGDNFKEFQPEMSRLKCGTHINC